MVRAEVCSLSDFPPADFDCGKSKGKSTSSSSDISYSASAALFITSSPWFFVPEDGVGMMAVAAAVATFLFLIRWQQKRPIYRLSDTSDDDGGGQMMADENYTTTYGSIEC